MLNRTAVNEGIHFRFGRDPGSEGLAVVIVTVVCIRFGFNNDGVRAGCQHFSHQTELSTQVRHTLLLLFIYNCI